jgi:PAS domain S-box-containing protein
MTRDVTELKQAEAERSRLLSAVEQTSEGIVITDLEGRIQYVNPALVTMTGYSREEFLGQNTRILKSGQHDDLFYRKMWQTLFAGETWHGEMVNRRKDGSFYTVQMTISPVRNEEGQITHFIAVQEDITARKQLEEQFRHAQKLEALGRLAGGVAHDFNNLLQIINGYCELLIDELVWQKELRSHVQEIKNSVERAADGRRGAGELRVAGGRLDRGHFDPAHGRPFEEMQRHVVALADLDRHAVAVRNHLIGEWRDARARCEDADQIQRVAGAHHHHLVIAGTTHCPQCLHRLGERKLLPDEPGNKPPAADFAPRFEAAADLEQDAPRRHAHLAGQ